MTRSGNMPEQNFAYHKRTVFTAFCFGTFFLLLSSGIFGSIQSKPIYPYIMKGATYEIT